MTIIVGFDVTWMNVNNGGAGGVNQYAYRVISALVEYSDIDVVAIIGPAGRGIFDCLKENERFKEVLLLDTSNFSEVVRSEEIDVVHTPVQGFSQNCTMSVPMISTLHDLQHIHYPEFFTDGAIEYRDMVFKTSAEFAERVIVSFDHVKEDIINFYGISPEKIDVCPIGTPVEEPVDLSRFPELRKGYGLPERYLFYSANTWRHKNHIGLIRALKIVHEKHGQDISLVCTGRKDSGYFSEIRSVIDELNLGKFVSFIDYIPDDDLYILLKKAALVVIPTLYEAGSYPLMEAMSYGVPVICSNVTSLPQTIGDSRFIFDPKDVSQMAERIVSLLENERLRKENMENSKMKVAERSWEKLVLNFVNSYTEAAKNFEQKKAGLVSWVKNYEKLKDMQINILVKERDSLLSSPSWRFTAPARYLMKLLKG